MLNYIFDIQWNDIQDKNEIDQNLILQKFLGKYPF